MVRNAFQVVLCNFIVIIVLHFGMLHDAYTIHSTYTLCRAKEVEYVIFYWASMLEIFLKLFISIMQYIFYVVKCVQNITQTNTRQLLTWRQILIYKIYTFCFKYDFIFVNNN